MIFNNVDRGEFLPYINGRYINPYQKEEKVTIIRGINYDKYGVSKKHIKSHSREVSYQQ